MISFQVSVIIVNYKETELLSNCLDSLKKYTKDLNYEVIVINNMVPPEKVDYLSKKYINLLNIHFINNTKNLGFAAANNQGIKIAKGKYILFLNNDTIFIENSLKKVYDFIEDSRQEVIVGCKLLNRDGSHQVSVGNFDTLTYLFGVNYFLYKLFPKSKKLNKYYYNYINIKKPIHVDFVKGAFLFISRKSVLKLKGFDESFYFYGEETDLCYRFTKIGGKVIYFPRTEIIHLGGASTGEISWFKFKNQAISKLRMYRRLFKGYQYPIALFLHYSGLILRIPLYFIQGILTMNYQMIRKSYFYLRQVFIFGKI